MIDINYMINQEILREMMCAQAEMASHILSIIKCPKSTSEYIENTQKVIEFCYKKKEQYAEFLMK